MAERPNKRARRQITEDSSEGEASGGNKDSRSSSSDGASDKRDKGQRSTGGRAKAAPSSASAVSRPRRGAAGADHTQSDTIMVARSPSSSPDERRRSIKLTVKMPSSKLREVTSQSSVGQNVAVNSRDTFEAGEIMTGKRRTRTQGASKLRTRQDAHDAWDDSEDSQNDEGPEASSENDGPGTSDEESEEDDDEEEEEEEQDPYDAPSAPLIVAPSAPASKSGPRTSTKSKSKPARKPSLILTPATSGPVKSVEEKEMEMGDEEDEELSELDSNGEEGARGRVEIDAEGDEDDLAGEDDAEGLEDVDVDMDVDEESNSDEETGNSRSGTPKVQTKRQRGQEEGGLLALPMEPQIKKVLTADEHRMRRQEMARRRKNLSEKRNEEEKMSTINRLLKRQAPKRRGKLMNPSNLEAAAAAEGTSPAEIEEIEYEKANPLYVRWISDADGSRLGVPEEWLGKKVGKLFAAPLSSGSHRVEGTI